MLKVIKTPDKDIYDRVMKAIKENNGYCPCALHKTPETKCMCRAFREQEEAGECHCGAYIKVGE